MSTKKILVRLDDWPMMRWWLAALLTVWLCLSPNADAYGAALEAGVEDWVTMDAQCGYQGNAKGGRLIPLQVGLVNTGMSLFQGTLRVKTMESDLAVYEYDYPVTLQVAENRELQLYVPIGGFADQLYVTLQDQDGNEVQRERLKLSLSTDVAELFIGVLSDRPGRLSYLDGAGILQGSLRTQVVWMDQDTMPSRTEGLDMMDVVLVTDYDIRRLSGAQYKALMKWARQGGVVVFGTGSGGLKALGPAGKKLLDGEPSRPMAMDVDMGVEYGVSSPADSTIRLTCMDLSLKDGNVILTSDDLPILTSVSFEDGIVAVAAYDFAEIEEFCRLQTSYIDSLFTRLLGEERLEALSQAAYLGDSGQYRSVQHMINGGSVDKLPNIYLYTFLIVVYLFTIGPFLYLSLKKRDLGLYYRRGVLIAAVCFACLIYVMGARTRFRLPFFSYATIQNVSEDVIQEYTYLNVRAPYNRPYEVALDPSYSVRPITRGINQVTPIPPRFTGEEGYEFRISHRPSQTTLFAQDVASFSPRYFYLMKEFENAQKVGMEADIRLYEGEVSGSITNHFSHAVEHVAVLFYGQVVVIDQLAPGETRALDGMEVWDYPFGDASALAGVIAGTRQSGRMDVSNRDYILALERANVLSFYLGNFEKGYLPDARILAFSTEKTESQFLSNESHETYGLTMFTSSAPVDRSRGKSVSRTALRKAPEVLGGGYLVSSNSMYGVEPLTLEYYLENDREVAKLSFREVSSVFLEAGGEGGYVPFEGTISFYNHNTRNFDVIQEEREFTGGQLGPYLSPGNTLTVRYQYAGPADKDTEKQLPAVYVVGREK